MHVQDFIYALKDIIEKLVKLNKVYKLGNTIVSLMKSGEGIGWSGTDQIRLIQCYKEWNKECSQSPIVTCEPYLSVKKKR